MKSFSPSDRIQNIEKLKTEEFDLLIIGGGINGAGVARDACMRGMKVALVEARDFASGTSSRSSKLIHGGIRYLENKEFHLVFEALSERRKLLEMAPHLVHPMKFLIPLYEGGRVGMGMMGLGMWLYDLLSLFEAPEAHDRLSAPEVQEFAPSVTQKSLLGAYTYSDAYMDDDRLTIETLRSANEFGLTAANYVSAQACEMDHDKKVRAIHVVDERTGKKFKVRAKHVLSTVGPWTDELGQKFFSDWKPKLRPTKGVHLTFTQERFPLPCAVVMAAEQRIVFAIPRHEMVIIGTTDTDFPESPSGVSVTNQDVTYLLGVIEKYFPALKIKKEDIVSSYAGVRPLVRDDAGSEGKTSREHTITTDEHGITYVMGGKYTTYRKISEDTLNEILRHWPLEKRVEWGKCSTELPLNPQITASKFENIEKYVEALSHMGNFPSSEAASLLARHGREAFAIVKSFKGLRTAIEFEAAHAILSTMCHDLTEFFTRRVPLFLATRDHGLNHLDSVVHVFRTFLGWSEAETQAQILNYKDLIEKELSWKN